MSRRRCMTVALTGASILAFGFGTALGTSQTIDVGNNKTLSPSGSATIDTGDTITWSYVGPDTNHIIAAFDGQAESWDTDPGLNDVTHAIGFTFEHLFTIPGGYTYRCRIHPDKMFGTITVLDTPGRPTAAFTMTPPTGAVVGQQVDFDGTPSTDGGIVMNYEWDLDGDGTFETIGPTPSRAYGAPGTFSVTLRVTDNTSRRNVTSQDVTITPPTLPAPPPPPPPSPLSAPPVSQVQPVVITPTLGVSGLATQRGADAKGVVVMALCDIGCTVDAKGTIALPGGRRIILTAVRGKGLAAGVRTKITLIVPKAARTTLRKLFAKGKRPAATITVQIAGKPAITRKVTLTR